MLLIYEFREGNRLYLTKTSYFTEGHVLIAFFIVSRKKFLISTVTTKLIAKSIK